MLVARGQLASGAAMETPPLVLHNRLRWLGLAGLLPQIVAVLFLLDGEGMRWIAVAGGYGYAAFIFSFLGGIWWAIALLQPAAPRWLHAAAVAPSLIALATFLPWTWGWSWPGPSLALLSIALLLSPIIDWRLGRIIELPSGWLALRVQLSFGLGTLTAILAIAA